MEVIKGDFSATKGIPPSGLCVGVHRAGAIHQKMVAKYGDHLAVWSLRPTKFVRESSQTTSQFVPSKAADVWFPGPMVRKMP